MERLRGLGAHAALVGEAIVTQPDPGVKIRELLGVAVSCAGSAGSHDAGEDLRHARGGAHGRGGRGGR